MRRHPPPKVPRRSSGRRRFDGELLSLDVTAEILGATEKAVRRRIDRGLLPYRKWNGRIVIPRRELMAFLDRLPGVGVDEALVNVAARRSVS